MRVTFRKRERTPALYAIRVDGRDVGRIQFGAQPWGWFWYVAEGKSRKWMNTCDRPVSTLEAAKAEVKAWLCGEGGAP